jgi:hypothetical protein
MASTALALLELSRARVARGWTQGTEARTDAGTPIDPWRAGAVEWSLLGTIVAAYEDLARADDGFGLDQLAVALHRLAEFVDDDSLAQWNDHPERTQADVVATLDLAVEAEVLRPPVFVYSRN